MEEMFKKTATAVDLEFPYYLFSKCSVPFTIGWTFLKLRPMVSFLFSVQNLYFLNYAEINVKRLAFCLKFRFQSKSGLCLKIAEVATTGEYFNIT